MKAAASKRLETPSTEKELDQAIQRVYEAYGSNLSSFFRDVEEQLAIERKEPMDKGQPEFRRR